MGNTLSIYYVQGWTYGCRWMISFDAHNNPILLMRKLRHREVKKVPEGHIATTR